MASKTTPRQNIEISDVVELLIHVPPRGKRSAILTMQLETGPHQTRVELTDTMVMDIVRALRIGTLL